MNKNGNKQSKHVLIVGGMGPQASVYAHSLLIKQAGLLGATENEDYPRITHISVNVSDFISDPSQREEARDYLIKCLGEINLNSVDVAFIACNTAHLIQDELERATGIKFVSLIDTTVDFVNAAPNLHAVSVISTPSTYTTGLYSERLPQSITTLDPEERVLTRTEAIIRKVIGGGDEKALALELQEEINLLLSQGAQKVILGCTELSLLGSYLDPEVIIDPLALTVMKALE